MYTCHCVGGLFSQEFLGLQTSYIQNFIMGLYPFSFLFLLGKNYHRFTGIFRNNMGRSCIHFSQFFPSYIVTVLCLNQNYFLEQCVFTVVSFHCMCRFVHNQDKEPCYHPKISLMLPFTVIPPLFLNNPTFEIH